MNLDHMLKKAVKPDDVTAALHTALQAMADNGYVITGCMVNRRTPGIHPDPSMERLEMVFRVSYVRPK